MNPSDAARPAVAADPPGLSDREWALLDTAIEAKARRRAVDPDLRTVADWREALLSAASNLECDPPQSQPTIAAELRKLADELVRNESVAYDRATEEFLARQIRPAVAADPPGERELTAAEVEALDPTNGMSDLPIARWMQEHLGIKQFEEAWPLLRESVYQIAALTAAAPDEVPDAPSAIERLAATLLCEVGKVSDPRLDDLKPLEIRSVVRRQSTPFVGVPLPLTDLQVRRVLTGWLARLESGA